ncbi:MAG: hypothetical protein SOR93_10835 [Clostridiales Family XIII bacterium]|uniref:Bro-N domain-containing protein n=1 Tax=Hominibacterium faecale TaxID=2839743 RepID=A0A9J6QU65_9FIRM|nr:hypothetical protein [Hominibacterium faecale]MCI7304078.1 hypothetical protein [Clostridia bacterium]MCU7379749.1 hypothetical protein [Hominibacterium faecale]MDY3011728.1 hypothetical protein [Clostridiales Family XIII bacterium]
MNEIKIFENKELDLQVRIKMNEDGSISMNAEDTAIGFGWCRTEKKNGKEYTSVMWSRMNGYCRELGFAHECAKDDYIPESLYYLLGMKAGNERALKYQKWLAIDVLPTLRKTGSYKMPQSKDERNKSMLLNAKARVANTYLKLANAETMSDTYKQVLMSKAAEVLADEPILPLPEVGQRTYTATEIGERLGVSANKVGRITESFDLKTDEYGMWVHDKSPYSNKEIPAFRYYESIIPKLRTLLEATNGGD